MNQELESVFNTFVGLQDQAFLTFRAKMRDYGPGNIGKAGYPGVVIRLMDKVSRLNNLLTSDGPSVVDESVQDTLLDISNYAIIGQLLLLGKWPTFQTADAERAETIKALISSLQEELNAITN